MSRRARTILLAIVAVVLLVTVVGPWVYLNLIQDDPAEELSLDDVTTTTAAEGSSTTTGAEEGIEGTWTVADGSVVGYRIKEVLFGQDSEAVGRTQSVTGDVTIEGTTVTAASFEVDMSTFESGESQRDRQFDGRIMEVSQFPTAEFHLTEPIELGSVPADGEEITATAIGALTLHGVTKDVAIDLTARLDGATFAVDGSATIRFTDFGIDDPSGGPASVGEDGELEVLLVFAR